MTKLLVKLFVRNDIAEDEMRRAYGRLAGVTGIIVNLLLFAVKLTAGLLSGSMSVTADSFNNLSDSMSSIVALFGFRIAVTPADREHPFGHGRAEYIASLVISGLIIVVGIGAAQASITRIVSGGELEISALTLAILGVSVIVKLWLARFYNNIGAFMKSGTLKTAAADSIADTVSTLAALLCGVLFLASGVDIDAYVGLGVSLFVIYTGIKSAKDGITPLLGAAPDAELVGEIEHIVRSHEGILDVHDLLVHNYGVGISMISLHAEVPADMGLLGAHSIVDKIELELRERFCCDVTIHIDPCVQDDELIEIRKNLMQIMAEISPEISMHDLHRTADGTCVAFDIVAPFGFEMQDSDLKEQIISRLRAGGMQREPDITIDKEG